jgi:hypothetical protein
MKKLFGLFLVMLCLVSNAQDAEGANNAIKMGYNFVTVSQTVVFNTAMQSGGTLTLSADAMDGGGRAPGDPFVIKMVFYNSSNQITNTAQLSNTLVYGATTPTTYTTTTTNCGGSCATVAYVKVEFYGKDGGYWAGNYGPYIINPKLTFNGGPNILYNPEFGVYGTNGYAQGWTSSNGWQSCALYSGAQTCVINNGAPVNGGNYSAAGGSTSSPAGGYVAAPTYTSSITTAQQTRKDAGLVRQATVSGNSIHIDQVGDNNTVTVSQNSKNNQVKGIGQQAAQIQGNSNSITVRQGNATGSNTGKNLLEISVVGDSNTINLNQSVGSTGTADTGDSNNHYQMLNLTGSTNTVTTQQKDTSASVGHFMETTVSGNTNTIDLQQTNAGAKVMFINVNGNSNTVSARQKDGGAHYLDLGLVGNGHNINAVQEGSGSHKATISLTNAGAAGTVNLTQTGTTGQVYSIQQSCSTSSCGATIVQGQ